MEHAEYVLDVARASSLGPYPKKDICDNSAAFPRAFPTSKSEAPPSKVTLTNGKKMVIAEISRAARIKYVYILRLSILFMFCFSFVLYFYLLLNRLAALNIAAAVAPRAAAAEEMADCLAKASILFL